MKVNWDMYIKELFKDLSSPHMKIEGVTLVQQAIKIQQAHDKSESSNKNWNTMVEQETGKTKITHKKTPQKSTESSNKRNCKPSLGAIYYFAQREYKTVYEERKEKDG